MTTTPDPIPPTPVKRKRGRPPKPEAERYRCQYCKHGHRTLTQCSRCKCQRDPDQVRQQRHRKQPEPDPLDPNTRLRTPQESYRCQYCKHGHRTLCKHCGCNRVANDIKVWLAELIDEFPKLIMGNPYPTPYTPNSVTTNITGENQEGLQLIIQITKGPKP